MAIPLILAAMAAAGGLGSLIGNARREGQANRNPLADSEDAATVDPGEDGLFNSVLEAIGRPGHAINDLLVGNFEGAGRQIADLGGDVIDSVLPGDWIDPISRRMDKANFSDVVGGMEPGIGKFAVDVLGGAATDPTMLIPGAAFARAGRAGGELLGGAVKAADQILPGTAAKVAAAKKAIGETADPILRGIRSTFGAEKISPETAALRAKGAAAGGMVGEAQIKAFTDLFEKAGLSDEEAKQAFRVINDYTRDASGKAIPILGDTLPLASDAEKAMAAGLTTGEEAGRQVDPLMAGEYMKEVKPLGASRGKIPALERGVGIKGVADPLAYDLLSNEAKEELPFLDIFNKWKPDQEAAARALDQAFPVRPTDPRFASGIDLANAGVMAPGGGMKTPTFLPGKYPSGFKPVNAVRLAAKEAARSAGQIDDVTERMLEGRAAPTPRPEAPAATGTFDTIENQIERYGQRVDKLVAMGQLAPEKAGKLKEFFAQFVPLVQTQYRQEVERGAMSRIPGTDLMRQMPADYAPRRFTGMLDEAGDPILGTASSSKERTLRSNQSLREHLNDPENAGITLEEDLRKAAIFRASQSGQKVKGATMAADLLDQAAKSARNKQAEAMKTGIAAKLTKGEEDAIGARYKAFNAEGVSGTVKQLINELKASGKIEDAQVLTDHIFGVAPRGALTSLLAKANKPFKQAAVAGFVIPKLGADVRNRLSGIWQTVSNPESRKALPGMTKRALSDIGASISDAIGMRMGKDKFTKILGDWDEALAQSGGDANKAIEAMRLKNKNAAALIESGVLDGYTRTEDVLKDLASTPLKQKWTKATQFPGRIMRGIEDRMRLGMGLDLMDAGHEAADAARITGDTLYRYGSGSSKNRLARDLVPFFQFSGRAIPQQAKFMAEQPGVATAISRAMSSANDPDSPVYPYMRGKLNIPIGQDEQGQQQFVSGFGLPFEALSMIPDVSNDLRQLGRSVERDTVGASQPLLKTAFSAVSGEDPYFQGGFNTYGKMPLLGEAGAAGRAYNLAAGTGLIQGFDSPARLVDKVISGDRGAGTKALDLLTGANVVSVDSNRALQQRLQQQLEMNPDVHSVKSLYSTGDDDQTDAMLEEYKRVKARIRAKKKAESLSLGVI
jgi:hypothetical protein